MNDQSTTNILLAIIAGCLLFGGGAMLSSLQVVAWIALVLGIVLAIFWGVSSALRSIAKDMRKQTTIVGKSMVVVSFVFLACGAIAGIRVASFMLETQSWNYGKAVEKTLHDPWGIPILLMFIGGAVWAAGALINKLGKQMFSGAAASYRFDMASHFLSAWAILPVYLGVRQYERARATGDEALSAALVGSLVGLFIWLFTVGMILLTGVIAFQNLN